MKKQLRLATTLIAPGATSGLWRHPSHQVGLKLSDYVRMARHAEAGKLDFLFQPDQYRTAGTTPDEFRHHAQVGMEPVTLLSALAAVTEHIGLAATLSTTYHEPYHVARMMASLDHLSGGRASWNIVHSRGDHEAHNFSMAHRPPPEERSAQGTEFVDIVKRLWDSWEDEAILADKKSGVYADPDKVHVLNHESKWFSVKGPLNVARPPQGHPVLIEAGQSERFIERAARHANIVFTMLNRMDQAQSFYRALNNRLTAFGRRPGDLLLMPGLTLCVGHTEAEAHRKKQERERLARHPMRLDLLSYWIGLDVQAFGLGLDSSLPDSQAVPERHLYRERKAMADRLGLVTVRELVEAVKENQGHLSITGTPGQIADTLGQWLAEDAADGFIFIPGLLPDDLDDLVELVVPELQRRGIFRTAYEGRQLRAHLGIGRPANGFSGRQS
ncbi:NtaA/DmoA family FMN-dependent monooxygenase [Paenibacillus sp. IB182496]|uniref:NtaA/DmoA family FMN-dependent monooxygenase n=1 Tax=Paenibacillus sabuli TaxID=2772509 RepID=A0A927BQL2_9BACL|nr:NtaA/DmoA family FMN-dependent monooxygenase [Paenibacillus sabuli]MBD2843683.1 NtaA/DmoA family FMN-dependent monooxygenase [Paenibacillus sabuli]